MDRQELIIPAKDVEIWVTFPGLSAIRLDTSSRLSRAFVQTVENIYAIGSKDPIGVADSSASYSINLSLQSGEYEVLLNAYNAVAVEQVASMLDVPPFTLAYAHKMPNLPTPSTITTSLYRAKMSEDSEDMSANDTATYVSLALQGVGLKRVVTPV